MEYWYLYLLAGLLAGIVSALFGVGAGIVMVPLLVLGFGFAQKSAQGTALFVMIPMALAGALRYYLNPDIEINLSIAVLMALGGVAGAVIGSQLVFNMPPILLRRLFAVFVIISGLYMLYKTRHGTIAQPSKTEQTDGMNSEMKEG
jgi:uncharacterized membrane protein YfcA